MQDRFGGIRMLRQDPWETLICFICSSNNNIARITKMVSSLCRTFSPPLLSIQGDAQEEVYHAFPPPSALATDGVAATLRSLGFGYRAEFIHRTAKMLVENHGSTMPTGKVAEPPELWLRELREVPTEQARQELLNFVGVGRKVADCILLMSLDKREVVPVDTHVHQIAIEHYGFKGSPGKMTPQIYDKVATKFAEFPDVETKVLFTADLKSFSSYGLPTPPLSDTNGGTPRQLESPSDSQSENPRSMATGSKKRQLRTADLDAPRPRTRRKRSYI
ncbi:hypothetical protein AX16_008894 [Volvariella volvacea WC 439]|nr:hypothetical protein AX16_008894 [Volvariella volvacea WC 439]